MPAFPLQIRCGRVWLQLGYRPGRQLLQSVCSKRSGTLRTSEIWVCVRRWHARYDKGFGGHQVLRLIGVLLFSRQITRWLLSWTPVILWLKMKWKKSYRWICQEFVCLFVCLFFVWLFFLKFVCLFSLSRCGFRFLAIRTLQAQADPYSHSSHLCQNCRSNWSRSSRGGRRQLSKKT